MYFNGRSVFVTLLLCTCGKPTLCSDKSHKVSININNGGQTNDVRVLCKYKWVFLFFMVFVSIINDTDIGYICYSKYLKNMQMDTL